MTQDEDVTQAARIIASGGVIAHPTEGVFGLACDPGSANALQRILLIKGRDRGKGLILLAHDIASLQPYCAEFTPSMVATLTESRSHPTTFIVPAASDAPEVLTGGRTTIAIRITTHPLSLALCRMLNHPVVSTSANLGGEPPARDATTVHDTLGPRLDLILDGPLGDAMGPSAIIDIVTGDVIRAVPSTEKTP
ncbi:MAG: L-threonylcarbamoyladenylate synthase [Gammaproteobacteria bacterium]